MHNKRRLLLGVVALTMPLSAMIAFGQPAWAQKAPPNPINCSGLSATVNFTPPGLSANGQTESSKTPQQVTVTGGSISNCKLASNNSSVGGGSIPTLSVSTKPTKTSTKGVYSYDTCSSFANEGPSALKKALKHLTLTIGGNSITFKTKSDSEVVSNTGEVGFQLDGQVKSGAYADPSASITAYLGDDSGAGTTKSFGTDFVGCDNGDTSVTIATASIDPASSTATL